MSNDLMNPTEASVDQSKLDFIKQVIAKDRTDNEITLMLHMASKYNLDPLLGEIYLLPFKGNVARPYVSCAGMLAAANHTGLFDGIETELHYSDEGKILACTCRVWRKDASHPFQTTVLMSEYNSGRSLWSEKPATMIVKVAQMHGLRLAFGLSGLYIQEEFDRADTSRYEPLNHGVKERKRIVEPEDTEEAF
jgi:phage recombination protein Bet